MEPIKTWNGEPVILTVANGGAGLILISQDGSADAEIPVVSRFLFVRSKEAALAKAAHGLDEAAARIHHRISKIEHIRADLGDRSVQVMAPLSHADQR
jgi:hypothetical protein